MKQDDVVYMVSARVVRRGITKVVEISITDGVDTWTFDNVASFTFNELKRKFPYFNQE